MHVLGLQGSTKGTSGHSGYGARLRAIGVGSMIETLYRDNYEKVEVD